jgi:phospholipid/cholesterol/gamma-HCH transport system substrate-binding protein
MEREANYTVVGAFVVLVVVMAGLFVYWYSSATEHRDYTRYEIYFDGSVFGLTRGGSVRYLGVEVGRVVSLRVDTRAATRVQVTVDIDADTPISDKTLAELSLQGITGLLYIDLFQNDGTKQAAAPVPSQRYPVIRSARSTLEAFVSSLPELVARVGDVANRAGQALSDANVAALSQALRNIDRATDHLPQTMNQIDHLVADLGATSADVRAMAANLRALSDESAPELRETVRHIREVSDHLADTTARLDQVIAENRGDVREFARDGLPQIEALVRDGRAAAEEFRALAQSLRENPSRILYQPAPAGLEIPP